MFSKSHPLYGKMHATSDHAAQSVEVKLLNKDEETPILSVRGTTWNMLNICRAKGAKPYSNNPFDVAETKAQYQGRFTLQVQELKDHTQENDFIFLQETKWAQDPELNTQMTEMLEAQGWGMVVAPVSDGQYQQKEMVTLYNKKVFEVTNQSHELSLNGIYHGYSVTVNHLETGQPVQLINLHLAFGRDYSDELLDYQRQQVTNGLTIMAGDTNNIQNHNLNTMIGDWKYPSNIFTDYSGEVTGVHQINDKEYPKRFDGFFVGPTSDTWCQINETKSRYFAEGDDGLWQVLDMNKDRGHTHHTTRVGRPWRRNFHVLKELDKQLGAAESDARRAEISSEMQGILGKHIDNPELKIEKLTHFWRATQNTHEVSKANELEHQPKI